MAVVTKASTASIEGTSAMRADQRSGLLAGEAIGACDACYIKSDGKVWKSNGTSANAAAKFAGVAAIAAAVGEPVTLFGIGTLVAQYATGMTPGAPLYIAATAGAFDTAATTGGLLFVARAESDTDIRIEAYTA